MQPTGGLETAKVTNPLKDLLIRQSLWLDYIRRDLISSGEEESGPIWCRG